MRVNINLASQKFEDVRRFYLRWGTAIAGLAVLAVVLAGLAWMNYSNSAKSNERIRELQENIASLERKRAEAEQISNRPENHDVTVQKNYWNKQITRRSFSWTQLFNDLQRIMPARAYVSSVHPEITQDNRLKLTLSIVGDKHDSPLELVQKMERSQRFREARIIAEAPQHDQRTGTTLYKLDIETYYTPAGLPQVHSTAREGI
ncbi:MAG TPA: hypothetical protein VKH81_11105 [Candidatus Angelobacter sp.]|nr:hypothetical protein [Candidatus Angelobacter sp.]